MRKSIIASLVLLAACGGETRQAADNGMADNRHAGNAQETGQRIDALPETQRFALFGNAIRDSGQDCQQVNSAERGGTYRDYPVWRATCRGGTVWMIVIGDNEVASVLNPNEAALIENQVSEE